MSESTREPRTPAAWRGLYAFGWPAGSVRAAMALIVFVTIWGLMVLRPDVDVPEYLRDLLFIILGHYFAARARVGSGEEPGPAPLFLPRGSVRLLLIAGFVVTAALLYRQERLMAFKQNPAVVTLLLAFGFLLGVVLRQAAAKLTGERRLPRWVEDARAVVSLAAAFFLGVWVWDLYLPQSPHWGLTRFDLGLGPIGLPHVASAVVGFYFGSRS